jgi:hypothetical protein
LKKRNTQWHPGCSSAIELELRKNREHLTFEREHLVNAKPIQMDMLIIKKDRGIVTENDIGKIFLGHNIIEFKSPDASLNYDTYIKGIGYACLYKAKERYVDEIPAEDITLTFLRNRCPKKLLKRLAKDGYTITEPYAGIYYIHGAFFPSQIIVTNELDPENHVWLRSLTNHIQESDVKKLAQATRQLTQKGDVDNSESVIEVVVNANQNFFESRKKEDENMYDSLKAIFQEEYDEDVRKAVKEKVAQELQLATQQLQQQAEQAAEQAAERAAQQAAEQAAQQAEQQTVDTVFDIQQQIRDGATRESLIKKGYRKDIVDRAYAFLCG